MGEKRLVFPSDLEKEVVAEPKAPVATSFFFKCGKPNLILTYNAQLGKKIFFQNYSFITKDESLATIIREKLVSRGQAIELTEENFFTGPIRNV